MQGKYEVARWVMGNGFGSFGSPSDHGVLWGILQKREIAVQFCGAIDREK
jgi:hypothetical protein